MSGGTATGANNQLLSDGTYTYQYDGEGNRTRRVEIVTGKVTEYVWDYRNRLASVLFKDGAGTVTKTIEYTYDVYDRRIGKKIDGAVTERYVYNGSDIALVFDGAGVQTHRYLFGTGVDTVLADERGGAVVWALSDNQGTVRDVVDGNGVILNHINYDSFGRVVSQTNPSVEFRFGYTGREQDAETGLDYYRARYYDAANGRFISEDPIGFAAGDSNLSRYVGNSPTNFGDPTGLQAEENPVGQWVWNGTVWVFVTVVGGTLGVVKNIWDGITQFNPGSPTKTPSPKPNPAPTVPPLNPPQPRPTPTPSSNPSPKPKPKPSPLPIPKPDDPNCPPPKKEETCADKYPEYSPLPRGLKFQAFEDKDLPSTISLMVAERGRAFKAFGSLRQGKTEGMTRKRYLDPNNRATHYNINIVGGNGSLGGSIGSYEFCIENGGAPYVQERFGILNIKSNPDRNGTQKMIGSDP